LGAETNTDLLAEHPSRVPNHDPGRQEDDRVRVAYPRFAEVTSGDTLRFNGRHEYSIAKVARHSNFDALLEAEDAERIYPSDPGKLLEVLREIYPPEKEALGVLAIHVRPDAAVGDE
jgi:ASC-1-like (ASCH) protein